jgi:phosphoribosylformimino-5-aminoimidazole carboxamide ribotide isomerase/phosphoribosylanthranilate isomerase
MFADMYLRRGDGRKEGGDLFETIERLERDGCARYVVTDVTKDGTLKGPNLELLKEVCAATRKPVIASGGILL